MWAWSILSNYTHIHIYSFFFFRWIKSFIEQLSVYTPERKQTRRQSLNRENKTKARNTSLRKQTKTPLKNKRNKTPTQSHKTYNRASRRSTNRTPPTCHSVNKSREQQKTRHYLQPQTEPIEECRFQRKTKLWLRCLNCPLATSQKRTSHLIQSIIASSILGEELCKRAFLYFQRLYTVEPKHSLPKFALIPLPLKSFNLQSSIASQSKGAFEMKHSAMILD
jgi:hypothetical protein